MSDQTKIEWATHTFNPWEGCTKVSPGCANCYAEARNVRFSGGANWGKGKPRRRTSAATWRNPLKWSRQPWRLTGFNEIRPRIFPSLCDWLDDEVPIEWLADFLKLIHDTPNLDWLLLTKRPENWVPQLKDRVWDLMYRNPRYDGPFRQWMLDWLWNRVAPANVWLGASVEDQPRADERIPELLKIPAAVRFLSVEPLLGPVDLGFLGIAPKELTNGSYLPVSYMIEWVIIGGESGPKARPCNVEWIRDLVRQCQSASVPCFVKQLGSRPVMPCQPDGVEDFARLKHSKGGDPSEWPEDLRVRQFPTQSAIGNPKSAMP